MRLRRRNLIALMIASSIAAIPLYLGARNPRSNQVADQRQALIVPKENEMIIDTIVERVEIPWSIAFAPDGRMFFTERRGRLRVVEDGTLLATPFATPEVSAIGEGGLLGVALDPQFDENSLVFAYHTYTEGRKIFNRIVRFKDVGNEGVEQRTIIDQIPGGRNHNGGRIKFGPDGKLYVGTGEVGRRELAQDLSSLGGKILRINPDGSVPDDNPFPNSPVFSFGHRNPQGLDWHPESMKLYSAEHGPSGEDGQFAHDEINIIEPKNNYGWPQQVGKGGDDSFTDPLVDTGSETWAPSGIAFYRGTNPESWRNNLFVATLRGSHIHRLVLDKTGNNIIAEEKLFQESFGRIRAMVSGPDGALYFSTSNRDGRGRPAENDDRILRLRFS